MYFDHNATTPLSAAAQAAWIETSEHFWHNPSSLYPAAGAAARRLEEAREQLADLLGAGDGGDIVFTSGATEANNALLAHIASRSPSGRCAVASIEHPSVLAPARHHFAKRTVEIEAGVDGLVDTAHLRHLLGSGDIAVVSVLAANNETGVIQPVAKIAELCAANGVHFHCDAAQWIGKIPGAPDADTLVGSAHKFGGPKGVGFVKLGPLGKDFVLQVGGPQEHRRRAGTQDLAGVAAMVAALANTQNWSGQAPMRDRFEDHLAKRLPGLVIAGRDVSRLPNTSMLVVPAGKNLKWLTRLGHLDFSISTGSACSSGAESGSHVLAAMEFPARHIARALRISSGPDTSADDWRALENAMAEVSMELLDGDNHPRAGAKIDLRAL